MSFQIQDRIVAGRELAARLTRYAKQRDVVVLAVPPGGVFVGAPISHALHAPLDLVDRMPTHEPAELVRRLKDYRGERAWPALEGRRVILVDDGVTTGATMHAAIAGVRSQTPAKIIVAVPVAPFPALVQLRREADEVVCLATPEPFQSVGFWYETFPQLSDAEVRRVLSERWAEYDDGRAFAHSAAGGKPSALTS